MISNNERHCSHPHQTYLALHANKHIHCYPGSDFSSAWVRGYIHCIPISHYLPHIRQLKTQGTVRKMAQDVGMVSVKVLWCCSYFVCGCVLTQAHTKFFKREGRGVARKKGMGGQPPIPPPLATHSTPGSAPAHHAIMWYYMYVKMHTVYIFQ